MSRMRTRGRDIAPQYLHARRPGQAIDGCECDACESLRTTTHYDRMALIFGLSEITADDLDVDAQEPRR